MVILGNNALNLHPEKNNYEKILFFEEVSTTGIYEIQIVLIGPRTT